MSLGLLLVVTDHSEMDPKDLYVVEGDALSTAAEVGNGIDTLENDTNSLQSLSHIDQPVTGVYMCIVLIAMILVGVIIIVLAVTISKLRKREDHHHHHDNSVHPEQVQQCAPADCPVSVNLNPTTQTTTQSTTTTMINGVGLGARATEAGGHVNKAMTGSTTTVDSCCAGGGPGNLVAAALGNGCPVLERTGNEAAQTTMVYTTNASAEHFIWQFPPPYTPPPQYTLYNDQDTLVHGLQSDRQGFAKGFRKNLGGRWRRLVKRKPESETCAIPPELKDQLKTIYVY